MVFVKLSSSFYLQDLLFILIFVHCTVSLKCNKSVVCLLELLQQIILREALHWALTVQAGDALCFSDPCCVSAVPSVPFLHLTSVLCNAECLVNKNVKAKMKVQDWTSALGYGGMVNGYFQTKIPVFAFCTCS